MTYTDTHTHTHTHTHIYTHHIDIVIHLYVLASARFAHRVDHVVFTHHVYHQFAEKSF